MESVGLDLGISSPALFAMMVLMALATTPLSQLLTPRPPDLDLGAGLPPGECGNAG